jgi:signal transduction histidine kinase
VSRHAPQPDHSSDVAAVQAIAVIPRLLDVVCRTTGLGFAAVARVTGQRWIACAVRDEIALGLEPGGELPLETTICNEIRQHGQLVVIDDVATDNTFCSHPTARLYDFRSYISVPIRLRDGQFFGTLCALDREPARLSTPETIGMFSLFAELIAFHLEAQQRVDELELRVAERTEELRGLTGQLQRVREDERSRIAREVHDELGQGLTAMKLEIAAALKTLDGADVAHSHPTRAALVSMAELSDSTLDAVERIITELRPVLLDTLGLGPAAEWLVGQFAHRSGIDATCSCDDDGDLPPETATALFRVLQEALTNVARHAGASRVQVVLRRDRGDLILSVIDNGRGISASATTDAKAFGLRGMRERLRGLGGELSLATASSGGTILTARCFAGID